MARVAVVGSRDFPNMALVRRTVAALPKGTQVVSGGARGVDTEAVRAAREAGLETVEYYANWDLFGKSAGYRRNVTIVENCDRVIAFWDGKSRGTKHTIDIATKAGKPVEVITA